MPTVNVDFAWTSSDPGQDLKDICADFGYDGPDNQADRMIFFKDYVGREWRRVIARVRAKAAHDASMGTAQEDAEAASETAEQAAEADIDIT